MHQGLLDELTGRVAWRLARREPNLTSRDMALGLLAELDDHNCWTMAEAAGHGMQHLLSRARVDERQMLDEAAAWAVGRLSAGPGGDGGYVVLIVDETAEEKSAADCVGAACQYSGTVSCRWRAGGRCSLAMICGSAGDDGNPTG